MSDAPTSSPSSADVSGGTFWETLTNPGDWAAASLGFAAGLTIDIVTHGVTVVSLGSAATLGATSAVGIKKSIEALIGRAQRATERPIALIEKCCNLRDEIKHAIHDLSNTVQSRNSLIRPSFPDFEALIEKLSRYIHLRESRSIDDDKLQPVYSQVFDEFMDLMEQPLQNRYSVPSTAASAPSTGIPRPPGAS